MTTSLRVTIGALVLFLLQFLFLVLYLDHEQTLSFWDYAMYANMAINLYSLPSGADWFAFFAQSFAQKYNLLFAVPSLASFSVFGPTHSVFILTNFVVFFAAYQVSIAFLLRQIFKKGWATSLFLSALLCTFVPFAWYPLFQGYPDHSAAACLIFAVGILLYDAPSRKQFLSVGLLLGLSILLRRHYAYPAIAVIATLGLNDLMFAVKTGALKKTAWLMQKGVAYGLMGLGMLGVLFLCEPAYVKEMWATDYTTLYKSYERTPLFFILFAFSRIGGGLLALSLAGYGLAAYAFTRTRGGLAFIFGLVIAWLVLWAVGPRQAGEHYLISLLPLFCVVGLGGGSLVLARQKRLWAGLALGGLFLAVNSAHAFWLAPFPLPTDQPHFSLLSTARPPWQRGDLQELRQLGTYIAQTTTDTDKIVVVGSSFVFNQDLIRAVYTDDLRAMAPAYRFLQAPESDGEQDPPLDVYASGTVFLVATPTQYHLPSDGQRVITSLASRFPPWAGAEPFFQKDSQTFTLDHDVTVEVWRRRKDWTPLVLNQSLAGLRWISDTPRRWVALRMDGLVQFVKDPEQKELAVFQHRQGHRVSTLFYDRPLDSKGYRFHARVRFFGTCENVFLKGSVLTEKGGLISEETVPVYQPDGDITLPFTTNLHAGGTAFVTLSVITDSLASGCTVALEQRNLEEINIQGLP